MKCTLSGQNIFKPYTRTFEQIKHFVHYKKQNSKELEVQQYLTHWFYVAIREMAALPLFQAEPEWIQNHLKVHVPLLEIKKALDFLIKNNFIKQNEDGTTYTLTKKNLDCLGGIYRLALTQFHKEMFQLASESIENTPSEKRHLMGHSFAITEENFSKVREILNNALEQIKVLETPNEILADIYHIELALFPLTKGEKHETH
ncbi:MAG: DUF4423 domain-containing protein [Deltaproteobacteria bacterium]|nr:DUF4423 domain-containing protein [Deltaproteobacteria bacterium]